MIGHLKLENKVQSGSPQEISVLNVSYMDSLYFITALMNVSILSRNSTQLT